MKVVLFCGGHGLRLRDGVSRLPKPMVPLGGRPVLWHLMRYYAHFGHNHFILCTGYGADAIRSHFSGAAADIDDWTIDFVDSGELASIGDRLRDARPYLGDDDFFLANYSDSLTDLDLDSYVIWARSRGTVGSMLLVPPAESFHLVEVDADSDGHVEDILPMANAGVWMNGGYFVFRQDIFEHVRPGDDLVADTFPRLMARRELLAHKHSGFWAAMDTFKDKTVLEELLVTGQAPWLLWDSPVVSA